MLDALTRNGWNGQPASRDGITPAEHDRAALRILLANGLIRAVPQDEWPYYVLLDAPDDVG